MNLPPEFELFTGQARRAVWLAYREAQRFDHDSLASVHLLAGLVRDEAGEIATAFREQSIEPAKVVDAIEESLERIPANPGLPIYMTPRVNKALAAAIDLAFRERQARAGPAHLLLAMIGDPETMTRAVLENASFDCERGERTLCAAAADPDRDTLLHQSGFDADRVPLDPSADELMQLIAGRWSAKGPAAVVHDLGLEENAKLSYHAYLNLIDPAAQSSGSYAGEDADLSLRGPNELHRVPAYAMLSCLLFLMALTVLLVAVWGK